MPGAELDMEELKEVVAGETTVPLLVRLVAAEFAAVSVTVMM